MALFSVAAMMTSCQDETVFGEEELAIANAEKIAVNGDYKGNVRNNGSWLVFNSLASYKESYNALRKAINNYKDTTKETDVFTDPEPVLGDFELSLKHKSLRYKLAKEEYHLLERGGDPEVVLNQLKDKGIGDEILQSFFNVDGVLQIDKTIYYVPKEGVGVKILDGNTKALHTLMEEGLVARYYPSYVSTIEVINLGTNNGVSFQSPLECNASFAVVSKEYNNSTGKYDVVFAWSQSELSQDFAGTFKWDFGDGSDPIETTQAVIQHAYPTHGNYTATLEISGEISGSTEPCSHSDFLVFEIIEDFASLEFCDYLGAALTFLGEEQVGAYVIDGDAQDGGMAFSTSGLINIVSMIQNVPDEEIVWTVNGETKTGHYAFFSFSCEGTKSGSLKIGDCSQVIFKVDYDTAVGGCEQGNLDDDFERLEYNNGSRSICYSTKTKSKKNYLVFFSTSNKIKVDVVNYRLKGNGKWTRDRADMQILTSGHVYAENACECEAPINVEGSRTKNNKKSICLEKKFNEHEGINYNINDPWYFSVKVNDQMVLNNQVAHP